MALLSLTVMVGSCVGSDSLTGTGGEAALGIQPALIPTPADGDALPINRIRISVARVPDGLLVGQSTVAVEPTDDSWSVDVSVPEPFSATTVRVFVWLLNVASDGTESVQFSGRSDPMELVPGEALEPDVPIVRGPLANLLATSVSIASVPTTMAEGSTATLTADVTTSGTETPTVYWTSLDPSVVSMSGAVATAVAGGTARVVASAGSFADTASIQVFPNLSITTASLPEGTQGTAYSQALAATGGDGSYTWSVTAGSLPSGLSLAAGTGAISGTPTTVEASSFTAQVTSGDGQTATLALGITVRDDAAPAFGVAESGGTTVVDESGTTDSFDLVLLAQPVTDVVLTVTNADTTEATVTPSTLTFTNATWDTPQSVTVTGVDDTAPDGDQVTDVTVSVDAASSDDPFDGLPAQTVSVTTTDDDLGAPGLTLNRWTGAGDGVQWIDPNNWSTGAVPVATDSVVIDADGDYSIVAVSGSVAYLTVGAASGTQTLALQGGTLSIDSAAVFEASSVYNHTDGTLTGPGDVTFRGGFTWSQGVITGTGAMTIEPGATATWGFAAKTLDGRTITNDGTVDLYETVVMTNGAVLINNGALNIPAATGSSGLTGGSSGTLVNNGTIVKTSGATNQIQPAFVNNGTLEVQFATLQFSGEFTHAAGALLRGNATVDLSAATVLDFSGEVAPGTSPGTLQIVPPAAGLVTTSSSSLTMEVGGTTPGSAYDVLTIPGIVTLAGDLLVDTINAFVPTGGDRFALMTFAGRAGEFASVTLPTIDGITLDTAWAEAGTTDTLYVVASSAGPANLVTWTGGGDGSSWSDGSNWSSGGAPTAGDSVVIQGATTSNINLDVDADVQSLVITGAGGASQVLSASGANLRASADILVEAAAGINMGPGDTISSGGQITVTDVAVLELAGSTVDGALDLQGGLGVHNASTLTGPLTTAATATIVIEGFSTEATLTIPAGFTNNGLIDLTDGEIGNATLSVQGTLVNNGTIRALPGVSGSSQRFLYAVLDNRATLEVSQTLTLAANSGTHRNSGTISVTDQIFTLTLNQASFTNESAGTIQLTGNGDLYVYYPNTGTPSFGQAGTITIGDGRNLLLSGAAGSFDITGGSITNNGVLDIGAVPAINAPAFAQSGSGVLRLNTTTWNGSGPLTNPPGATLDLRGAVINADVVNRGNVLTYSGIINGRLTVPNTEVATFTTPSTPYGVQAQGLDIDGAVFDRATLAVNGTDIVQMSNVTFQNQDVSTTQLQVTHTGAGSPFTLDNVAFGATTNAYIGATDTTPVDADTLTIILTNSTPADGSANTTTNGGAVVYWGAPPAALNTWTGAAGDALWSTPANWSGGVPAANDSVVIDLSSTSVILDQDAVIQSLQLGG
ncbi:MAG: putative Ig domain-containing protein, partial [Gemmatimonadota bacterium]